MEGIGVGIYNFDRDDLSYITGNSLYVVSNKDIQREYLLLDWACDKPRLVLIKNLVESDITDNILTMSFTLYLFYFCKFILYELMLN